MHFLRNDEPTDPLVARLGENGWWSRIGNIEAPKRPTLLSVEDDGPVSKPGDVGPDWLTPRRRSGVSREATALLLQRAIREGALVEEPGPRGARSFHLAASGDGEASQQVLDLATERQRREEDR